MVWRAKKEGGESFSFFTQRFFLLVVPDSVTKRETHRKTQAFSSHVAYLAIEGICL